MTSDLDWNLDERPRAPQEPNGRRGLPRWAIVAGVLIAVVAASAFGALQLVQQRVQQQERDQRAAVLALAELEERLARSGDREGVGALQDAQYLDWSAWRQREDPLRTFASGPLSSTVVYGMQLGDSALNRFVQSGATQFSAPALSGEQAVITATRRFTTTAVTGTLKFAQPEYFRLIAGGWRRSGPPVGLATVVVEDRYDWLRVQYPTRDAAVLAPLAPRLNALAARACADVVCPAGRLGLIVSANVQALVEVAGAPPASRPAGGITAYAPAPALIGRPQDPAGLDALYRFYGIRLLAAVAAQADTGGLQRDAWLRLELERFGLEQAPAALELQATARLALQRGQSPFYMADTALPALYLGIDFLQQSTTAGQDWRATLDGAHDLAAVYRQVAGETERRTLTWWAYLEKTAALEVRYPGSAQMAAICQGYVFLWNVPTASIRPLGATGSRVFWSPDGRYLAIADSLRFFDQLLDAESGQLTQGTAQTFEAWAPGNTNLILAGEYPYAWNRIDESATVLGLPGDLAPGLNANWVAWSPDMSAYALIYWNQVFLGGHEPGSPLAHIGAGLTAAWSPDSRYLAVATNETERVSALRRYDLAAQQWTTIITFTSDAPSPITQVAWSPDAARLAAAYMDAAQGRVSVVSAGGALERTFNLPDRVLDLQWSPDGGELGWSVLAPGGQPSTLTVLRLADGSTRAFALSRGADAPAGTWGWSPDNRWLAFEDNAGGIRVLSRDGSVDQRLPAGCLSPAWRPAGKP